MAEVYDAPIMLVEDNPHDAEMAIRALKKNKLANELILAEDGEQALDYLFSRGRYAQKQPQVMPKLILLDIKLPKIGGIEVLKVIKSDPKLKVIPVIILTSSKEENDIVDSYKLGVNSYIVKPVEFDKFVKAVGELGLYWLVLNQHPRLD